MPGITRGQDTLICDNGGFEDGFQYYFGSVTSSYYNGGDNCSPIDQYGNPSQWSTVSLPQNGRFAIVNSGTDPLVGISRTKFGNKAAKLNNYFGHEITGLCFGLHDVNKIIKRFKVTSDKLQFSIWYAAVLENPNDHNDSQPFFSITCDLAPNSDLCFDASDLNCLDSFALEPCTFPKVQVVDWSCHKISIPETKIGNIATIEITAADCGCGAHFGYAYIDGFCETCTGSSGGVVNLYNQPYGLNGVGIKYYTCDGNNITICGNYELPFYCNDEWDIDNIQIPGFTINNISIDKANKKFCFDLPKSNFQGNACRVLNVTFNFKSLLNSAHSVRSNDITICPNQYLIYNINNLTIGTCNDNLTSLILSDDYYYINCNIGTNYGDQWTITRVLNDPYPGEQGIFELRSGNTAGSFAFGPFLIQEGEWEFVIDFGDCSDTAIIVPPDFCSGCESFWETKITNISCDDNNTMTPNDDTWSFDIFIPGPSGQSFSITGIGTFSFNSTHPIQMGAISFFCEELELEYSPNFCSSLIVVCPPHPCSDNNCTFEAYLKELDCPENNDEFSVKLDIIWPGTWHLCYRSFSKADPTNTNNSNNRTGQVPSNKIIGTFDEDIYLFVYHCPTSACTCVNTICFKGFYVPKPDCEDDGLQGSSTRTKLSNVAVVNVLPNPILDNKITIQSNLKITEFEIVSLNNLKLHSGIFKSSVYSFELNLIPGIYLLKFKDDNGEYRVKKFVKF